MDPIRPRFDLPAIARPSAGPTDSVATGQVDMQRAIAAPTPAGPGGRPPVAGPEAAAAIDAAHAAVRSGDAGALQALLTARPELLVASNRRGETLLSAVIDARHGGPVLATLLSHDMGHPASMAGMLEHRNFTGETPLLQAIGKKREDIGMLLLRHADLDVNAANRRMETPLHVAIQRGSASIVAALMASPRILPSLPDVQGNTPLHLAVSGGSEEIVRRIAAHPEALPMQANHRNETPLTLAVAAQRADLVAALAAHPNTEHEVALQKALDVVMAQVSRPPTFGSATDKAVDVLVAVANAPGFDPARRLRNGHTLMTLLCALPETALFMPTSGNSGPAAAIPIPSAARCAVERLAKSVHIDINATNRIGKAPFEVAIARGNMKMAQMLVKSEHFDRNGLTAMLMNRNTFAQAFALIHPQAEMPETPAQRNAFLRDALASWVDQEAPGKPGTRQPGANRELTLRTNLELGRLLMAEERAAAAASVEDPGSSTQAAAPSQPGQCARDAVFRLTLALDLALEFAHADYVTPIAAELMKASADRQTAVFNIGGTPVSRNEVETWAAGRLPPGIEARSLDRAGHGQAIDPHGFELRSRGRGTLEHLMSFEPGGARITQEQTVADIQAHARGAGDRAKPILAGLAWVQKKTEPVAEGLNTNSLAVLAATWNYIQAQEGDLRENLTAALMARFIDIDAELRGGTNICATGCVQRILDVPNAIDPKLTDQEPDAAAMKQEVFDIAGKVNMHFEGEYATPEEEDEHTIGLKQAMVRATAESDLVGRRGWDPKKVEAALAPVLESMKYL